MRHLSVARLVLALSLLGFTGCAATAGAPPRLSPPPLPLPEPSVVRVPIVVDLAPLVAELTRGLPRRLAAGTQELRLRTAGGQDTAASLRYDLGLEELQLSADGNRLSVGGVLSVSVSVELGRDGAGAPLASCGIEGPRPQLALTGGATVEWGPDAELILRPEPWIRRWIRPCRLDPLGLDLEEGLRRVGHEGLLLSLVNERWRERSAALSLGPRLRAVAAALAAPIPIGEPAWLSLRPEAIRLSPLVGTGRTIRTTATLVARPLVTAEPPQSGPAPAPPSMGPGTVEGETRLEVRARIPYERVAVGLAERLRETPLEVGGQPLVVREVRVYPSGERLVLGLSLSQPLEAWLYLWGRPVYDPSANRLSFADVDYTVETDRRLAGAAGELLRPTLRRLVEERAQVDGGSFLATVRERLARIELSFPGGTFRGGATRVELRGVHLTPTGFEIVLGAAGSAEIILGP